MQEVRYHPPQPTLTVRNARLGSHRTLGFSPGVPRIPPLGVVASRFSTGGPGSYGAALADTDPVDVRYYFDVNRKIREGLKMKAACAAIAKEYGDHQTKIGTLTKRYRRLHARLGPLLRSGSEP